MVVGPREGGDLTCCDRREDGPALFCHRFFSPISGSSSALAAVSAPAVLRHVVRKRRFNVGVFCLFVCVLPHARHSGPFSFSASCRSLCSSLRRVTPLLSLSSLGICRNGKVILAQFPKLVLCEMNYLREQTSCHIVIALQYLT